MQFAPANMPAEEAPCAKSINNAESKAKEELINVEEIAKLMCLTEEYAIKIFMSVCCRHRTATSAPPTSLKCFTQMSHQLEDKISILRTSPYPPNFNKIAAKIIDPATGAST